jgi:16S rRNA (cytidine1402-2'-O)-methyltransferase
MVQKSFINNQPTLYLVPTPIGNLDDMTFRAVKILEESKIIFAEDTRTSRTLLNHFEIKTPLKSYHDHNRIQSIPHVIGVIKEHHVVSLISDAGMPAISDPGYELVAACVSEEINVVTLPGANAALTALVSSGIAPQPFTFYGFLNHKESKRRKELSELNDKKETLIFYESPHRIESTLSIMLDELGDRTVCIGRELTKKFEEYTRGKLSEITLEQVKGEFVIVVEGNNEEVSFDDLSLLDHIKLHMDEGMSEKDSVKTVAKERGLKKNDVYQVLVEYKKGEK